MSGHMFTVATHPHWLRCRIERVEKDASTSSAPISLRMRWKWINRLIKSDIRPPFGAIATLTGFEPVLPP